jgi:CarD family transcriptional regulator
MNFNVGDQVVHWSYGLGEIVQLDEKMLLGRSNLYYVLKTRNLVLWVPVNETGEKSLRYPTPPGEFVKLFDILRSPAAPLSRDRLERKKQLSDLLRDGKLESVCRAIRDLVSHHRTQKLSDYDATFMERALGFLISEWTFSLSVSNSQAMMEINHLLGEDVAKMHS